MGLIGDDVHAVAREMKAEISAMNIFGFSCEGYKGVSQSAGHHIANNSIFNHVVGLRRHGPEGKFRINILGEYNIGGDAFELERILEHVRNHPGFHLQRQFDLRQVRKLRTPPI